MKHAWLIIAHNEFEILQMLISALDDPRNDIFVHIDRKIKTPPHLYAYRSDLLILDKRINVHWGGLSQIKTELLIMEEARKRGPYERYHIISGTHLPLKSQNEIHSFFASYSDKEIMHLWEKDERDIGNKLQRINLFTSGFTQKNKVIRSCSQLLWRITQRIQKLLRINRFPNDSFIKSDNWLSLTDGAVQYLCDKSSFILKKYRYSYCGDEYFVASELTNQGERFKILDTDMLLYTMFERYSPKVLTLTDFDNVASSGCLFARKFSSSHIEMAQKVLSAL